MRFLLAAALLTGVFFSLACGYLDEVETEDIVSTIPWADEEESQYVIVSRDDEDTVLGRGTLSVSKTDGEYELVVDFANEDGTDVATVLVDENTLKPSFVRRVFGFLDGKITEGTYDPVEMIVDTEEIEGEDRRLIPARLEEHYYDNESSLFLWRTIRFEKGYQASYSSVLVNRGGESQVVTLLVDRQQEITVPAGTFTTWRVMMRTDDVQQVIWFAVTPDHVMIQYDNSRGQLIQLTETSVSGA